jgi:hypothetical protein
VLSSTGITCWLPPESPAGFIGISTNVLKDGFSFKIDSKDEYREDLKIINYNNEPIIFIEVKGTNRGVKREHINQADSHRERAGLGPDFPSILLINTDIKKSASIEDKDQPIAEEQVKHAVKIKVLILRTLDLLFLLRHLDNSKILQQDIIDLFSNNAGWLKVDNESWKIVQ